MTEKAQLVRGRGKMERTAPKCPDCGEKMTFYSGETYTEHYICTDCDRFTVIPRPINFFNKNPFKPKIY
jgi:transposase-like protein